MKHTKLLSCLLALVLLLSCFAGLLAVGAGAESATVYYTVGDVTLEGAEKFNDINTALDAAEKKNHQWKASDVLEIQFKGNISGGSQDGLLFGQTTIWREDGTKLPIIIRGVDTAKARDAFIYVDSAGGWYACANDYHFKNLTIPVGNQLTDFYAGSGNVSFENVYFSNKDVTIRDAEDQKIVSQLLHDVARTVSARNNASLVPAGDAWQDLLDNNSDVGLNLWYSKKNPFPSGDYQHDGDLGGGQYLNACVWYEVLTKRSCVGNTWRPDETRVGYTLSEELITVLQNAAHKAVVDHYGEDYYDSTHSPDTIADNEVNVLVIGSSTGYYFPDEVSQLLNAAGYTARVGMAYHSGVRLEEQWSWKENGTGDYAFRLYEKDSVTATVNASNGALMKGVGFDSFMELYDWDAIGIYQSPGPFLKTIDLSAYDDCLATCDVADDLYAFYKETNPDARYLWYQGATKALGYPGVGGLTENSGRFFGDNCTQAVFEGWPELKEGERVQTSITFGPGTEYYSSKRDCFVAAIGYMEDYAGAALTEETAKEVTYMEAVGYTDVADIRPIDVDASIIIDGEDCRFYEVFAHLGHAPSNGTVHMKQGTVQSISGDNFDNSAVDDYYGDMILKVSGGNVLAAVYGTYSSNVVGDLIIDISEDTAETAIAASIRGTFGTGTVTGDVRMSVRGGKILAQNSTGFAFYGGGSALGEVVNTISGGTLEGVFFGVRSGTPAKVVNNFTGGTINADVYGGHYAKNTTMGNIINNISGTTINGAFYGGGYNAEGQVINEGDAVVDGKTVQASIVNNVSGGTFNGAFYGGGVEAQRGDTYNVISGGTFNGVADDEGLKHAYYGSGKGATCGDTFNIVTGGTFAGRFYGTGIETDRGDVTNTVSGGTFNDYFYGSGPESNDGNVTNKISGTAQFKARFFGSYSEKTVGNVVTEVTETPVFTGIFYGMGWDAAADDSKGKTLTVKISGGTFSSTVYLSGQILRHRVATHTVSGGTFNSTVYFGAYNSLAKEVNTTVKGGVFNGVVYGGNNSASNKVEVQTITNTIESGEFNDNFYGGCKGYKAGSIHNIVKGGTFNAYFYGGNNGDGYAASTSATSITNEFSGGDLSAVYSGSYCGAVGSIHNTVKSGTFGNFIGGNDGLGNASSTSVGSITNELLGGTFNNVYCGTRYGTINTVTNTVNGAKTVKNSSDAGGKFYCGYAGTGSSINNTIKKVTVADSLYMGNHTSGSICNSITSVVENATVTGSLYCGNGNGILQGKAHTTIKAGCNIKTYTYACGDGVIKEPEGFDEEYLVECEILGGTFKGVWAGGASGGTNGEVTANVKLTVRGGTFKNYSTSSTRQNALCAGGRNKRTVGNTDVFIYGGSFTGEVIAGACPNSADTAKNKYTHDDVGNATVTIYGGSFSKPILANSKWGTYTGGKVILNPTESDIIINSTMVMRTDTTAAQSYEIIGADHKIILGADAEIEATAISGDVKFGQGAAWAKRVYVTLPEGNTASVTVTGPHCFDKIGTSVVAVKGGIQLSAATMILTDRVAIRALFDKASVDQNDGFTFTFTMGEEILAEGNKESLEPFGDDYYGIVLAKIGANDFTKTVSFAGSEMVWENEFSIKTLAESAETAWEGNDKGVALAKAMQNFATIVNDPTAALPHTLAPDMSLVEGFEATGTVDETAAFQVSGKGLVMGNAVGIRIYGTSAEDVTSGYFTIKVNGTDVTDKAVITAGESNAYTVDLYVNAKSMSTALRIEIIEKKSGKVCLDLTDRVDAIAASYPGTHENYNLVQQLLVYIQAAVNYAKA